MYDERTYSPRQQQLYRYNQPSTSQYESFFEPIPIEFLQGVAERHQQKYDTAYGSALAGKTAFNEIEVGDQDLARRNELVENLTNSIETQVAERYGGDWAKAGKYVARAVSGAREDPFWDLSRSAMKEREKQAQEVARLGDKAYILEDANRSVYDPETGQYNPVRSQIVNMQDWQDSVRKQFEGLRGSSLEGMFRQSGVSGILQATTVEELSDDQLRKLAENPDIVDTFLNNNPGFQQVKEHQGYSPEEIRKEASDYIFGNIRAREYKNVSRRNISDPGFDPSGGGGGGFGSGTILTNIGEEVNLKSFNRKEAAQERTNLINQQRTLTNLPTRTDEQNQMLNNINTQIAAIDRNNKFLFESMQADPNFRLDVDALYDDYVKKNRLGVRPMSKEQFTNVLMNDVLTDEDITPRGILRPGFVSLGVSRFGSEGLNSAVRQARRHFDNYIEEGNVSQSVNILNGTTGRREIDTRVGMNNNLLTESWRNSQSQYIVPFSDRQVMDVITKDRRYSNRDATKDTVVMTDGSIGGKFMYQLNIHDKDGNLLGSEYIIPKKQDNIQRNLIMIAEDMMRHGYTDEAEKILQNAVFGPAVQTADIYNKKEGVFEGTSYGGRPIHFKNEGTRTNPRFTFYVKKDDGTHDPFAPSEDSPPSEYFSATDEAGIKTWLMRFFQSELSNQ